jgi:hypothetical protein
MREVVRGDTTTELDRKVQQRERRGWKRISENKLDDSGFKIDWACVMEFENELPGKKRKWGNFK